MKRSTLMLTVLAFLFGGRVEAQFTTYNIVNYPGYQTDLFTSPSVTDSIVGSTITFPTSDINTIVTSAAGLSGSLTITNPSGNSYSFPDATVAFYRGGEVLVTATQVLLVTGEIGLSGVNYPPYQFGQIYWINNYQDESQYTGMAFGLPEIPGSDPFFQIVATGQPPAFSGPFSNSEWVIAQAQALPEPSGIALLGLGVVCLAIGYIVRKRTLAPTAA